MSDSKHRDEASCRHCGEAILFWDGNPGHRGAHWYHKRSYPEGHTGGQHPNYCSEIEAAV